MKELGGKVAVVTGAASGIGFAMSDQFTADGMKVVMADVEEGPLDDAAGRLASRGADVLPVPTDVRDLKAIEALADAAFERYGAVHVVCNNAGVAGSSRPPWELSQGEWEWVMGVNLWGAIHGTRTFVPRMIEQGEGHIVNTASVAGLITGALSAYSVTKHAVVALSEATYHALRMNGHDQIGVSVLCPGWVRTRIWESDRNRPSDVTPPPDEGQLNDIGKALVMSGIDPADVAGAVKEAITSDRFYILTHDWSVPSVARRMKDIIENRHPTPPELN